MIFNLFHTTGGGLRAEASASSFQPPPRGGGCEFVGLSRRSGRQHLTLPSVFSSAFVHVGNSQLYASPPFWHKVAPPRAEALCVLRAMDKQ